LMALFSTHISTTSPIFHSRASTISGGMATLALPPLLRMVRLNFIVDMFSLYSFCSDSVIFKYDFDYREQVAKKER